uniref:PID domain-containing protein n=1 Tax=Anopheles epiroticus TaxID=199890 RepID=A0A182PHH4_9DIPT
MSTKLSNGSSVGGINTAPNNTSLSANNNNNNNNDSPDVQVTVKDLPISFKVKYLGSQPATGLWGIKHTRLPVDHLVSVAKNLPPNRILPFCNLTVSLDGVKIESITSKLTSVSNFTIDTISYGVQDLVYTRVFAMIVVKENYNLKEKNPFDVHAFVCDSRAMARKLTFALAASFQDYSKRVKEAEEKNGGSGGDPEKSLRKKFAIDLRTPEEMQQDITEQETEA